MNQHTKSKMDGGDGLDRSAKPHFVTMPHKGRVIIGVAGGSDVVAIVEPNYLEYAQQFAAAPDLLKALEAITPADPWDVPEDMDDNPQCNYCDFENIPGDEPESCHAADCAWANAQAAIKKARGQ